MKTKDNLKVFLLSHCKKKSLKSLYKSLEEISRLFQNLYLTRSKTDSTLFEN